jgi:hypothetical protein
MLNHESRGGMAAAGGVDQVLIHVRLKPVITIAANSSDMEK